MGKVSPSGEILLEARLERKGTPSPGLALVPDEWVGEGSACHYIPDYHWLKYIQKINVKNARTSSAGMTALELNNGMRSLLHEYISSW
jgi:hypothetical protein